MTRAIAVACSVLWLVAAACACSDGDGAGTKGHAAVTGGAPADAAGGTGGQASGGSGGSTILAPNGLCVLNKVACRCDDGRSGTQRCAPDGINSLACVCASAAPDAGVADAGPEDSGMQDASANDAGATNTTAVVCGEEQCAAGQICCIHGIMFEERACTAPEDCPAGLRRSCESSHDCGAGVCCLSGIISYQLPVGAAAPLDAGIACADACGSDTMHAPIACGGASDCADGELCCNVVDPFEVRLLRTECAVACGAGAPLCRADADCPSNTPHCDLTVGNSTGHRICTMPPSP